MVGFRSLVLGACIAVCACSLACALFAALPFDASAQTLSQWRAAHAAVAASADGGAAAARAAQADAVAVRIAKQICAKRKLNTKRKRIRAVHDWLARHVRYCVDERCHTHEAYGALVSGQAQCSGYARAFRLVCSKLGFKCVYVVGKAHGAGGWELHAWNKVRYAGKWRHVDVTFDDAGGVRHRYFLKSARAFKRDHRW